MGRGPRSRQPDEMFCPTCGAAVKRGVRFCTQCGANLATGPEAASPPSGHHVSPPPKEDVAGVGRYILSFFLAGLIGLALTFFLRARGWLATWISLGIFVVVVIAVVIAAVAAGGKSEAQQEVDEGYRLGEEDRYEEAIAHYTRAIELDPEHREAYTRRCFANLKIERPEQSIQDCTVAIELEPEKDALVYTYRALALGLRERHEEAIEDFTEAIRLDPGDAEAYGGRAVMYQALDEYEKAVEDATTAISLDPDLAPFYWIRGQAHFMLGQEGLALRDAEKVLSLTDDPDMRESAQAAIDFITREPIELPTIDWEPPPVPQFHWGP